MLTHLNARPPGIHPWQLATYASRPVHGRMEARASRAWGSPCLEAAGCQLETGTAPRSGFAGWGHLAGPNGESGGPSPARPPPTSMQKKVWSKAGRAPLPRPPSLPLAICQTHPPKKTTKSPYTFKGPIVLTNFVENPPRCLWPSLSSKRPLRARQDTACPQSSSLNEADLPNSPRRSLPDFHRLESRPSPPGYRGSPFSETRQSAFDIQ
ncbi:hypothetical protein B0T18DRAFT_416890 [Schizothecium vesticola]|uniref:Uncharacterized protein n=1 Tax=Schizothecium vesticola TaxID=314040 RepID=A0AA40ERM7_9PEZI|nr:hypothetical protein B0T18DRAFT_416890 [Schizothecium vesticola]